MPAHNGKLLFKRVALIGLPDRGQANADLALNGGQRN